MKIVKNVVGLVSLVVFVLGVCRISLVFAETDLPTFKWEPESQELTLYGGILFGDSAGQTTISSVTFDVTDMKDTGDVGLRYAYNITENWGLEATVGVVIGSDFTTTGDNTASTSTCNQLHYHINGLYNIPMKRFIPYATLGVGAITFFGEASRFGAVWEYNETGFAFNYGGGFKLFLTDNIGLRADLRDIMTEMEDLETMHLLELTGGIVYRF